MSHKDTYLNNILLRQLVFILHTVYTYYYAIQFKCSSKTPADINRQKINIHIHIMNEEASLRIQHTFGNRWNLTSIKWKLSQCLFHIDISYPSFQLYYNIFNLLRNFTFQKMKKCRDSNSSTCMCLQQKKFIVLRNNIG